MFGFSIGTGDETNEGVAGFNLARRYTGDFRFGSSLFVSLFVFNFFFNLFTYFLFKSNLLGQATTLIDRMRKSNRIDFAKSWKLITIYSGSVDLCWYCKQGNQINATDVVRNVEEVLDYINTNSQRTFVNLVLNMDLSSIFILSY